MNSRQNVAKAAKMMDAEVPGWYNLIDLDSFEMLSCSQCVLGQVFGAKMEEKLTKILGAKTPPLISKEDRHFRSIGWSRGLTYLRERGIYDMPNGSSKYNITSGAFAAATCHWVEEIAERRAKDEVNSELPAS